MRTGGVSSSAVTGVVEVVDVVVAGAGAGWALASLRRCLSSSAWSIIRVLQCSSLNCTCLSSAHLDLNEDVLLERERVRDAWIFLVLYTPSLSVTISTTASGTHLISIA